MRRAAVLILAVVLFALVARLFWLKEIVREPDLAQHMPLLLFTIGLTVLLVMLQRGQPPLFGGARRAVPARSPSPVGKAAIDALVADWDAWDAMSGEAERPARMHAWGLHLHSPFVPQRAATSWFGGVPRAPAGFDWPRADDGQHLYFVAQIDLAALTQVADLGGPPPGLPRAGALLVFVGLRDGETGAFATRILTPAEVAGAQDCPVPDDLSSLRDVGFWIDPPTFPYWPLDVVGFADDGRDPPGPPAHPVATWGLAAHDLGRVATALRKDIAASAHFRDGAAARAAAGPVSARTAQVYAQHAEHCALIDAEAPALLADVESLHARAAAQDPLAPVDAAAMAAMDARRAALAGRMQNYPIKFTLRPDPARLARDLIDAHPGARIADLPAAYRSHVEPYVTGWRGHRLFGKGLPPSTQPEDLRGLDCLISILSDPLLGTRTEHESGFSIWADRAAMFRGDLSRGRLVLHTTV